VEQFTQTNLPSASLSTEEFFKEIETIYMLDRPSPRHPERRESPRIHVTMPIQIDLLDDNFDPIGSSHEGMTRDLSPLGVGFVTLDPIGRKFALVRLSPAKGKPLTAIARIVYKKEVGFYYRYGCHFITPDNEHFAV
jgi:hypothetical protein